MHPAWVWARPLPGYALLVKATVQLWRHNDALCFTLRAPPQVPTAPGGVPEAASLAPAVLRRASAVASLVALVASSSLDVTYVGCAISPTTAATGMPSFPP